jgi:cytochrome P450
MMMGLGEENAEAFSDEELLQETVSLFQGGFDTSSGTLGWVFYMLAQHPDVAQRLQTEVDAVLAGNVPASETAQKLTYTHQVIQETMRLYPSAAAVVRLAAGDDELASYHIPASSLVMCSFYAVHRHPDYWDEPQVFRPERFAEGEHKACGHAFAYVPFATGPRMCIGDQFALYEMRLTIAALNQRYRFSLDPSYQLEVSTNSTYFPKRLPMRIERR